MKEVSVHEAKAQFASLLRAVEAGETVVITRHDRPVAELHPIKTATPTPVLGAFATVGAPHLEVSWTDEDLADLFSDPLK